MVQAAAAAALRIEVKGSEGERTMSVEVEAAPKELAADQGEGANPKADAPKSGAEATTSGEDTDLSSAKALFQAVENKSHDVLDVSRSLRWNPPAGSNAAPSLPPRRPLARSLFRSLTLKDLLPLPFRCSFPQKTVFRLVGWMRRGD